MEQCIVEATIYVQKSHISLVSHGLALMLATLTQIFMVHEPHLPLPTNHDAMVAETRVNFGREETNKL